MNLTDMIMQAGNETAVAAKSLKKQGIIITRVTLALEVPIIMESRKVSGAAEFVTSTEITFEPDNEA